MPKAWPCAEQAQGAEGMLWTGGLRKGGHRQGLPFSAGGIQTCGIRADICRHDVGGALLSLIEVQAFVFILRKNAETTHMASHAARFYQSGHAHSGVQVTSEQGEVHLKV